MIRLAIFDLGGTLVDKYSMTPVLAFKRTFDKYNIRLTAKEIYQDMGIEKSEHISKILNFDSSKCIWDDRYKRAPNSQDVAKLFREFRDNQRTLVKNHMTILPETQPVIRELKRNNVKIAVNTGFDQDTMIAILEKLNHYDIEPDYSLSSTCMTIPGRPDPSMIYELMKRCDVQDPRQVVKIDDTPVGIKEGKNAGCHTIGVARWSAQMGVNDPSEFNTIDEDHNFRMKRVNQCIDYLRSYNPDYVTSNLYCAGDIILNI